MGADDTCGGQNRFLVEMFETQILGQQTNIQSQHGNKSMITMGFTRGYVTFLDLQQHFQVYCLSQLVK